MLSPSALLDKVATGNDAAWALSFHTEGPTGSVMENDVLTIGREHYYAEVAAVLPAGLDPGQYTITIEGLTDAHYAQIERSRRDTPTVVRLYLYWRDTNASPAGYLANLGGLTDLLAGLSPAALRGALVAELAIDAVSRSSGARRYETTIIARERAFARLHGKRLAETLSRDTFLDAIEWLARDVGVPVTTYGFARDGTLPAGAGASPGNDHVSFDTGVRYAKAMRDLGTAIEEITKRHGRGMLLIRDGHLIVGPRPIPPDETPARALSHRNGLVETVKQGKRAEPTTDADPTSPAGIVPPAARDVWKLTLKGRPDIKPGDVVTFHPPPEDQGTTLGSVLGAAAGSFLGPLVAGEETGDPVTLYVDSVEHRLGRTAGFVTMLAGVTIADGSAFSDAWDSEPGPGSQAAPDARGNRGATTGGASGAVRGIRSVAEDAAAAARNAEIGEVRGMTPSGAAPAEPPGQTLTIWRGLDLPDGRGNQARRLPIRRRNPARFEGVAYASPFAWGKCGLVLPRYPGTRVLMVNRNAEPRDPVEIGAVWASGSGPTSKDGDWWLILPSAVPQAERAGIPDTKTPQDYQGEATNDLIDADGNRVIEVGELTLRVGTLKPAGSRPARGAVKQGVTIEHTDGKAMITIDPQGRIEIHAKGDLTLTSDDGSIKLVAPKGGVDVAVKSDVNVH